MGCCASTDNVSQPKKTIIIQQPDPVPHIIPLDNVGTSVINERQRIQFEEEERERREALERAEAKRREAHQTKTPPKAKHSKLLAQIDDKYKNLQSLLILLYESLHKHDKEDKEISTLMLRIKSDAKEIEDAIEDLQSIPFPDDKEYIRALRRIILVAKNLELEAQNLKKKVKKYPEYKKSAISILREQYAELFDDSKTQTETSIRKSVIISPKSELRAIPSDKRISPSRSIHDKSLTADNTIMMKPVDVDATRQMLTTYDDPFDREMAGVIKKQRDDVEFELNVAMNEYNRLQNDFNVLKMRQENLQKDYRTAQQEIKNVQQANKKVTNFNEAMGKENENFKNSKGEVVRSHEQSKKACADLEKELADLRSLYVQRVAEGDQMDQEYEFKAKQLEYEINRKQQEAKEIEKNRKEEELKHKEDERKLFDDDRRREEHERRHRDIERKRQEDERRHQENEKRLLEELRKVEAKIEEVDRQRRSQMFEQFMPIVSDFTTSIPVVRDLPVSAPRVSTMPMMRDMPMSMPVTLPPLHRDPREVEIKIQEDLRRLHMMNEEVDRHRAHAAQQLAMPVLHEIPPSVPIIPSSFQFVPAIRLEDVKFPNKYSSMTMESPIRSSFITTDIPVRNHIILEPTIVNGERRSIYVDHERPRRSVTVEREIPKYSEEIVMKRVMEDHISNRKMEGISNALDQARRARMGMDRSHVAAAMDHKRLEAQNVPINYQSGFGF